MIKNLNVSILKKVSVILVIGTFFSLSNAQETKKEKEPEINAPAAPAAARPSNGLQVHSVGIGIGQTFLKGDLKTLGDDKITWDAYYNYSASHSFDFIANFHFSSHDTVDEEVNLLGLALGIKAKIYQFDSFAPFGFGGLGFYSPKVKRTLNGELTESEDKIVFGTHLGVGADLRLNDRATVGIIGHYHNPFDVEQKDGTPDVEGSYVKLLILGLYSF